jgi:hypothetical protein
MITLFCIPKAFRNPHITTIQRNAIRSWTKLRPQVEIILAGDDEGVAEAATEFGALHIGGIARNEFGTPMLNDIFQKVEATARYDTLCYINGDIILLSDFLPAVERTNQGKRLMVGYRWDLDVSELLSFENGWEEKLRDKIRDWAVLHQHTGIDYFVFPRGLFGKFPPFAVGRGVYDNWMIYKARDLGVPVVDASRLVTIVHQNHDYSHIANRNKQDISEPERNRNLEAAGGYSHIFTLHDVTHLLTSAGLRRPEWNKERFERTITVLPVLHPKWNLPVRVFNRLRAPRGLPSYIRKKGTQLLRGD